VSEGRFVRNLIGSVGFVALGLGLFVGGTFVGNEMINSQDSAVILFGFAVYPVLSIVEILITYAIHKLWRQS